MDRRLTAYVLKYLLEHRFESKAEMARQLGMRQRTIEKVFANLDVAKAGTILLPETMSISVNALVILVTLLLKLLTMLVLLSLPQASKAVSG